MPSPALIAWSTESAAALSQLEGDDRCPGERARQLDYALRAAALRPLPGLLPWPAQRRHQAISESIDPEIGAVLDTNLSFAKQLDQRNAQPATLTADFSRFGIPFWACAEAADPRTPARRRRLEELNTWRNAIAHYDIANRRGKLVPHEVTLATCRSWRAALDALAGTFDRVIADRLQTILGIQPW